MAVSGTRLRLSAQKQSQSGQRRRAKGSQHSGKGDVPGLISFPALKSRINQCRLAAFEKGDVPFEQTVQVGGGCVVGSILSSDVHRSEERRVGKECRSRW